MSLRDVERAMIVFEYFYENMDKVFALLTQKRAQENYNELFAVDSDNMVRGTSHIKKILM